MVHPCSDRAEPSGFRGLSPIQRGCPPAKCDVRAIMGGSPETCRRAVQHRPNPPGVSGAIWRMAGRQTCCNPLESEGPHEENSLSKMHEGTREKSAWPRRGRDFMKGGGAVRPVQTRRGIARHYPKFRCCRSGGHILPHQSRILVVQYVAVHHERSRIGGGLGEGH